MPSQEPRTVALAPIRHVATVTTALIAVTCVAGAIGTWTAWHRHQIAVDYVAGVPGVGVAAYVSAENTHANVAIQWLLAYLATGVMFLTWSWRARYNAELLSPVAHRLRRGWVIGGWVVPLLPLIVLEDVWRTSRPDLPDVRHARELPRARLVHLWWYAALACMVSGLWLWVAQLRDPTVDALRTAASITSVLAVAQVVAAALIVPVIHRITRWQTTPRVSRPA